MTGQGPTDRLGKAIETAVYAPLGLGLYLRDFTPSVVAMLVARGRAEIDRRQQQANSTATTARSIGQIAVAFGVPELRRRVGGQFDTARDRAETVVASVAAFVPTPGGAPAPPTPPPRHAPAPDARVASAAPSPPPVAPPRIASDPPDARDVSASDDLPIPGYDELSASQVVERLAGLSADELAAVRAYEAEHRKRRTILGKIDQLAS
ncbi:MAG TPA: hypothetical protein VFZ83_05410 [Acidimicrobiia bacterium]|nr:hypothetical protein [Acidimicrobiia bacterium]